MIERRPHWDDELIMAVVDEIENADSAFYPTFGMVASVIAAVEDWHRDRWTGVCESPEEVVQELKQAQAAIQRVRDLCAEFIRQDAEDLTYGSDTYTRAWVAHDILQALDGETPNKGDQ